MESDRRTALEAQKAQLVDYARMKLDSGDDYHGVCDAGMDIREIDARLDELERATKAAATVAGMERQATVQPCRATVAHGPCVMLAGHQGPHANADEWTAETH